MTSSCAVQLAEAVSQIQGRVEGLLHQGWKTSVSHKRLPPIQTSQQPIAKGSKNSCEGAAAASHNSSQATGSGANSEQPSGHDIHR